MHDQARREITPQQPVVRRRDREVAAEQIEPSPEPGFSLIVKLRDARLRAGGARPAAVVHDVPRVAGKQKDVARLQLQRPAAAGSSSDRRASEHRMIRDFVRLAGPLIDAPWRAVGAAQVQPPPHRHHLEQPTEPVHGDLLKALNMRRWSI